jgi:CubicO group peptidase (beta-lactamase class C family)
MLIQADFFKAIATKLHPVTVPFHTPVYSNAGFVILGYALEKITGKTFQELLKTSIADPLGLHRTSYSAPANNTNSIIPGGVEKSMWSADIGDTGP